MALSDKRLMALKPKLKPYKVADGAGLYAFVSPAGGVLWRFDYMRGGKRKTLSLGRWPAVSLYDARDGRDAAQKLLAQGGDPCEAKAERKRETKPVEAETFEEVAIRWHQSQIARWTDAYSRQVMRRLDADVFPHLGAKTFGEIARADVLDVLRRVEQRGLTESVKRVRQYLSQIFRFAGAEDDSITDPIPYVKHALQAQPEARHHAAFKPSQIGDFLHRLESYDGEPETRFALRLTTLTAARTGETIGAKWTEFEDWRTPARALWRVPADRMKAGDEHLVPLSPQVCALLGELHRITGQGRYLFPAPWGRAGHMSNNAMLYALYRLGYRGRATVHGLRGTFSTWSNEGGFNSDVIELCLAHDERNKVRAAYNSAKRLDDRRILLRAWADFLDAQTRRASLDSRLFGHLPA